MRSGISEIIVAAGVLGILAGVPAQAAPMRCTGEQTTCIAACQKGPRGAAGDCIANCRARTNYCNQTGCWDDGVKRYCGLLRH